MKLDKDKYYTTEEYFKIAKEIGIPCGKVNGNMWFEDQDGDKHFNTNRNSSQAYTFRYLLENEVEYKIAEQNIDDDYVRVPKYVFEDWLRTCKSIENTEYVEDSAGMVDGLIDSIKDIWKENAKENKDELENEEKH